MRKMWSVPSIIAEPGKGVDPENLVPPPHEAQKQSVTSCTKY